MAEQKDAPSYGVTMVVDERGAATIDYHELLCGGTLTPLASVPGTYRERITYGRARCTDGGRVRLTSEGDRIRLAWFDEKDALNVAAMLERKRPAGGPPTARPKTGCDPVDDLAPSERLTWEGACVNALAEGRGILQWFKDGKPTTRYEGDFRLGNLNGRGALNLRNGDRYEGEFRDGDASGKGIYLGAKGNRYEGEWRDGKPNGIGTYATDKATYSGTWNNGCFREGERWATLGTTAAQCGFK